MTDGAFRWELIDHRLVGLKLTNLAEEMHESIRAEIGQIQLNNIGNSNSQTVPSQMIAMHLRRADEWIEKTYRAYCEVWEKQGHPKTAAFIRAVSSHAIATIVSARTNAVVADLSTRRARTGSQIEPHNARMESFKQSMSRLAARWARKLEIEAKECGHAESATRRNAQLENNEREAHQSPNDGLKPEMNTAGGGAMSAAKLPTAHAANVSSNWARLYEGFVELAREERAISPRVPGLIASVLPDSSRADVAKWETHQTPSASLKGRFDLLATHAGAALGPLPRGVMPIDYWLHRLRQFLSEKRNKWLHDFISTDGLTGKMGEHPSIDLVCEASALFCTHLGKEALERTYAQEKELEACYNEWITHNFVSASLDRGNTYRGLVGLAARTAQVRIPIEFLSCNLDVALPLRGFVAFSSPDRFFDDIADSHKLSWWITERGLWMAQESPSGVPFVDRNGSLTDLERVELPLSPADITPSGAGSLTNRDNEAPTFKSGRSANTTLKNPIGEGVLAVETKARRTSTGGQRAYRTPLDGLKPEMKIVDFSDAMLAARLTDKQYDCFSLVKEYQRPMGEVEQRLGITRKTIHEHIAAAENAMRKLSLKDLRAKAGVKRTHPD